MPKATFATNPVSLEELLVSCDNGKLQLPDFQRGWVWAEDRILSLIVSVSRAFPIGALMTLVYNPDSVGMFARREIEGAPLRARNMTPSELLLDGQQRMTSLYQACMRREVVETITPKNKLVKRWFYFDIRRALQAEADRDQAVFVVPEDRRLKTNFDRDILLDLSKPEYEYEQMMYPLNRAFDWDDWQDCFHDYCDSVGKAERKAVFRQFKNQVLQNFKSYDVPVISLVQETSHEAVCLVFEKVNTGGKPLDAFELLTAMYAARGHKLRHDWFGDPDTPATPGLQTRLTTFGRAANQKVGILAKVSSIDFFQAIALLHTKQVRADAVTRGVKENDLPAVRATRQAVLDLPLDAYLAHRDKVEQGFQRAAKFLRQQNIYQVIDLPYQTQLVPLAAIFAEIGDKANHAGHMAKIARWYWCGVFGELYGSAVESRFARDIVEVPLWLEGGPEPVTVTEGIFRSDRLLTMRTRLSAAYKGIHALLMREGAKDFRSGQSYSDTVFFEEGVDIHHIFPEAWCKQHGIDAKEYDTVINKSPLSYQTNRIIGGVAPSKYLNALERGRTNAATGLIEVPSIAAADLDRYLVSHCISAQHLRADDFKSFMKERRSALLRLVANATGHPVNDTALSPDEGQELTAEMARDSGLVEIAV